MNADIVRQGSVEETREESEIAERLIRERERERRYHSWIEEGMDEGFDVRFYLEAKRRLSVEETGAAAVKNEARFNERLRYRREHETSDEELEREMADFDRELQEKRGVKVVDSAESASILPDRDVHMERTLSEMEMRTPNATSGDERNEFENVIVSDRVEDTRWTDSGYSLRGTSKDVVIIRRLSLDDVEARKQIAVSAPENVISDEEDKEDEEDAKSELSLTSDSLYYYGCFVQLNKNYTEGDLFDADSVTYVITQCVSGPIIVGKLYIPTDGKVLRCRYVLVVSNKRERERDVRVALRHHFKTQTKCRAKSPYFNVGPCEKLASHVDYCAKLYGSYSIENESALETVIKDAIKEMNN